MEPGTQAAALVPPRHAALRLASYYAACFLATGLQLPFWPRWLSFQGLGSREIGVVMAVSTWVRPLVGLWVGTRADQQDARRGWILRLTAASCLAAAAFGWSQGFLVILLVSIVYASCVAPLTALGDSLAQLLVRGSSGRYGRLRLWGSASFLAMAVGAGHCLSQGTLGFGQVPWLLCACQLMTVTAAWYLPDLRAGRAEGAQHLLLREVFADRRFRALLLASCVLQASHAAYYAFGTVHWRRCGLSEAQVGWLWAEGVVAEILLFLFAPSALASDRGVVRALVASAAAGVLRWGVSASSTSLVALAAVQWLHAMTFGVVHLAVVGWIGAHVPAPLQSTAQTLNGALAWGVGLGLAMLVCGELDARSGVYPWLAMAGLSAAGGVVSLRLRRA